MPARRPIAFLATDAPDQALTFYRDVLGLYLAEESPFALVFRDGDVSLRVQIVPEVVPHPYTAHGWDVTDIDHELASLVAAGVEFLQFDGLPQDGQGVWSTPDGARIAWFKDPSGNLLSLTQFASES